MGMFIALREKSRYKISNVGFQIHTNIQICSKTKDEENTN